MKEQPDPIAAAEAALDRVVQLQARIDALSAERAEALLALESAFSAAYPPAAEPFRERAQRAELACALRLPERAAESLLGEARMLSRELPETLARLADGQFSYRHAQVLIDETAALSDTDRAAVERVALGTRDSTLGLSSTQLDELGADPDAMLHVQQTELGYFPAIVPTVVVTVPLLTLLGGSEPGALEGIGPIDAVTARRLVAEAPTLHRMLTDPDDGTPLSLSRTSYRVPEPLRRWLRLRDGTCRFPMCGIHPGRCDIDHTRDWTAHGGPTDHDNLAHLSRGHHTLKHHGGWRVSQDASGNLSWTSYLVREYTTQPDAA